MLKTPVEPYWDLPGGRIKRGDTIEQTLLREVEEETGIKELENIKEAGIVLSNIRIPVGDSDVGLILGIYDCQIRENTAVKISEEHTSYNWYSQIEASELLKVKYPKVFTDKIANL